MNGASSQYAPASTTAQNSKRVIKPTALNARYRQRITTMIATTLMPQLDGKQALRQILELDPDARVVILSSLGAQNDIEECLRAGARSYLQKPIDSDAMIRVLRETVA